jgi:aminopeptidase N
MPLEHRLHARCGCFATGLAEHAASAGRPFALPTSSRHFERDRPFAIDHLALDIVLDLTRKSIRAEAAIDVRRIDPSSPELLLDAVGFDVRELQVDGAATPWRYDGRTLYIPIGVTRSEARVTVRYEARPRRGLYFIEPDEHYPHKPRQVWSQCQEEDARHWFPCHDSPHVKMTTEIVAHVPNGYYALSNGTLVASDRPETGAHTYAWRLDEPHSSYLVTLVAGEFAEIVASAAVAGNEVPLTYLVPKGREADGQRTFAHTADMVRLFSEVTGVPYPWKSYTQVVVSDFIFGGMENTTATTLYEHVLLDERAAIDLSSDDLVAHELAHQWFGDYVTCRDWYEGWLNEGFATYLEHVWRERLLGQDEYYFGLKADLDAYLVEANGRYRRAIVCQEYDAPLDLFDRHLYEKGGLVLHALRREVGDELFWRGIRAYLNRHARGVVETRDLQRALEEVSGRGLGRFFEQWVYKPGHPEMDVEVSWERGILSVSTKQTQATSDGVPSCFELPLDLDLVDDDGAVRRSLRVSERQQSFAIPVVRRPSFVVVDPTMRIIGEVRVKVPADMLREQLRRAPTARGQWLAAKYLAKTDDPPTIDALAYCLAGEQAFWGTRAECAAALGKIRGPESFDALEKARSVAHPKVRRAVVDALGTFRTHRAFEAIKPIALRDDSYLVEGEAARALGRTRQAAAFDLLVDLLDRASWFDVVRAGAIDGLAELRDDRAVPHLTARLRYGHPARVRRSAALALPKLATDRRARETLEQLLEDPDPLLRVDAVRAIGELVDPKSRPALRDRLEVETDPRVRRRIREVLRDLTEPKRATEPLREELEKLLGEHGELKARMAKLEARLSEQKPPSAKEKKAGSRVTPKKSKAKKARRARGARGRP